MVTQGRVPYHTHDDRDIREALAIMLGERNRQMRQRLVVIFLFVIVLGAFLVQRITDAQHETAENRAHFENAVVANCRLNQKNAENFNRFIDKLVQAYSTSPALSAAQRRERAQFFMTAKSEVPACPPRRNP